MWHTPLRTWRSSCHATRSDAEAAERRTRCSRHPDPGRPDRSRTGATMAERRTDRRSFTLEVGFEPGRGSRDALGRAYEHLLPSLARAATPGPPRTWSETPGEGDHRRVAGAMSAPVAG